jgi:alpha-D-xyloside xylohydrolase
MSLLVRPTLACLLLLCACPKPTPVAPDAGAPPRHTPRWAFEPWISKDISTGADTYDFVDGFRSRDIPVGVVVIDSPWETNYHSFIPNPTRYPEFPRLVSDMAARDVKVVLWMTQFLNVQSFDAEVGGDTYAGATPNYGYANLHHYFVNDGALEVWWKGQGAAIDFFNPEAVSWWHTQQDQALDLGIAGWKLDFGDSYITHVPMKTAAGEKSVQEYGEAYYHDFLAHGRERAGQDFLTMTRAYDRSYVFSGRFFAKPDDAPVAWAGDNRRDWVGLQDALDETFRSANAGYIVLGSDIGGYLDIDDVDMSIRMPFSQTNFSRWVAVGALSPFMQLHGKGNFTPWTVPDRPDETVATYRYWAKLHHQLVPFFFSLAEEAAAGKPVPIAPIGTEATWPGDYRYVLGDTFLVAPILDDTGVRDVPLPAGARWIDWWSGSVFDGGTTLTAYDATDRAKVPLLVKEGSVLPLEVGDDSTRLGTAASAGRLTVLAWPGPGEGHFVSHDVDGAQTTFSTLRDATARTVTVSRAPSGLVARIWVGVLETISTVDGLTMVATRAELDATDDAWRRDGAYVWVRAKPSVGPVTLTLR